MNKVAKIPGPDHPIAIAPTKGRVIVRFSGQVIADSAQALTLTEASYPGVQYIPRADAKMAHYKKTAHSTYCPFKGDASYFTLSAGPEQAENAVWSYETPYPAMREIAGYLAFYPNKVEIEVKG